MFEMIILIIIVSFAAISVDALSILNSKPHKFSRVSSPFKGSPAYLYRLRYDTSKQTALAVIREGRNERDVNGGKISSENDEQLNIPELVDLAADEAMLPSDSIVDPQAEVEMDATKEQDLIDRRMMLLALDMANSSEGERGPGSPFPKPVTGAVLVAKDGTIIGRGRSSYDCDAVQAVIADAGLHVTPLSEWCVTWSNDRSLRNRLAGSTLYITLEPSDERKGNALPPITQLIQVSGIHRVVIGCPNPIPEQASTGAAALHAAGLEISMGVLQQECEKLIEGYSSLVNSKLQTMARKHFAKTGRPLGFLHCSVVTSDNIAAFARNGNAFGKDFGGKTQLSFRDFGAYELAPPPVSIWANEDTSSENIDTMSDYFNLDFDDEEEQENHSPNPMMPWYEQVDAVVVTFPRCGNGPAEDQSVKARLNGLKWLATQGNSLPANVERILVMDASDLTDLPLHNDDPNLPSGVDIEAFWRAKGRKASRILLRRGENASAMSAASAAALAAEKASQAALLAKEAIESGDADLAAEAAIMCQEAALASTEILQKEMQIIQTLKDKLTLMGVKVEVLGGGEPIDVMNYLGKRNGYKSVVWRAGCWGERGVKAIMTGAFQWVSAHIAVDAVGGKFWQLMLAERAVQAACGPESKVTILAQQEDFSLEYCDEGDQDCILTVDGRPIRHIRLDCRVAIRDPNRKTEYVLTKTAPMKEKMTTYAPWFL